MLCHKALFIAFVAINLSYRGLLRQQKSVEQSGLSVDIILCIPTLFKGLFQDSSTFLCKLCRNLSNGQQKSGLIQKKRNATLLQKRMKLSPTSMLRRLARLMVISSNQ